MNRKDFEKLRLSIERLEFSGDFSDPMTYGIQRADFELNKYRRLIAAAQHVNSKTVMAKVEQWKRQMLRAKESRERFEKLREETSFFRRPAMPTLVPDARPAASP